MTANIYYNYIKITLPEVRINAKLDKLRPTIYVGFFNISEALLRIKI